MMWCIIDSVLKYFRLTTTIDVAEVNKMEVHSGSMEFAEHSIVRIFSKHSQFVVGAGFLVTRNHVLTCAHVISEALSIPKDTQPSEPVLLNMPFLSESLFIEANVILWGLSGSGEEDIALLELVTTPPKMLLQHAY